MIVQSVSSSVIIWPTTDGFEANLRCQKPSLITTPGHPPGVVSSSAVKVLPNEAGTPRVEK